MDKVTSQQTRTTSTPSRNRLLIPLVVLLLLGLPIAAWLDLQTISDKLEDRQTNDLNDVITGIRGYYAEHVVKRIKEREDLHLPTQVVHNYEEIPGAIPIPARLSLELGDVIRAKQRNVTYRFISDYPFKKRAPHVMDGFERSSLNKLTLRPDQPPLKDFSWSGSSRRVRLIAPIMMEQTCVSCHNTHPESPKKDWKVGDVRGIQEVDITEPVVTNVMSFKYLLLYFVLSAIAGFAFIGMQYRQEAALRTANTELEHANDFLASISTKISRYLSPQIYKNIFSGQQDVTIHTERKRLTIFFSDIKDFTATTERSQPEAITLLLNEYFTEMSAIALKHGGTIDKFIGDAILIFFGDPESQGDAADARACVHMAFEMQSRLAELNVKWRESGVDKPFQVRMGINTGFCNVGNFGSATRMDYTIIGAEANLAARLQSIAEPGRMVLGPETYALVRDLVSAKALPPISMKGISKEVTPYQVQGMRDEAGWKASVFTENDNGFTFYMDMNSIDARASERLREVLRQAAAALETGAHTITGPADS